VGGFGGGVLASGGAFTPLSPQQTSMAIKRRFLARMVISSAPST
jgi:hypothetical protein